jgi:hypothetical protein
LTPEACGLQRATRPRHGRQHAGRHHRQWPVGRLEPGWRGAACRPAGRARRFRERGQRDPASDNRFLSASRGRAAC